MSKLLKTTGIFILGIGLLTGCSEKVAQKAPESAKILAEEKQDLSTTNQLNIEDRVAQEEKIETGQKILPKEKTKVTKTNNQKHSLAQAGKILEPMTYGMLNLNGSSAANVVRYVASRDGSDNQIKTVDETYVLDLLNTYNAKTYNKEALLQRLRTDKSIEFVELNDSAKNYTKEKQEKLINKKDKVVYFKKDRAFLVKSDEGYGGATDSIFEPVEKWEIKGDRVIIPYVTIATHKPTGVMTLRLNNKNYESGNNKTMYYIEKFELY